MAGYDDLMQYAPGAGNQPTVAANSNGAQGAGINPTTGAGGDNAQTASTSYQNLMQFAPAIAGAASAPSAPDNSGQTPDSATDVSPVSFLDRARMSVGNDAGSLDYLKRNYEDAKQLPDGRMVVKQGGKWSQVDPSGLGGGNAWDKAKELAKDTADLGGIALNAAGAIGATVATGLTGGAAIPVVGAAGLATGGVRTSLGRIAGTYQATPEEQLKDIGLEGLMNAGGEVLAIGAKPVLSKVAGAVKSFAEGASDQGKQAMAAFLSWTTKASPENTTRLMERAPEVMGEITAVQKSGMPSYKTDVGLVGRAMDYTKGLFQNAQKALSSGFDAKESELLATVPGTFKADISQPIHQGMMGMVEAGMVRPVANSSSGEVIGYKMAPREDILKLFKNAEEDGALTQQAWLKLKDYVEKANGYLAEGTKTGSDAVETLINIRRGFDKFYYAATDANQSMKQLLTPASSQMRQSLVTQIGSASKEVAEKYGAMNQMYQETMPYVVEAGRVLRRFNGTEAFVNRLQGGDKVMAQRLVETMAQLKGKGGQELAESLKDAIAARDFVGKLPKLDAGRLGAGGLAAVGAHATGMGPVAAVVGAPLAAASSPRLVGRAAQGVQQSVAYASKFGDMLKSLPPDQMKQFISDPNLFPAAVRATLQAGRTEDTAAQQLLQMHGVPTQPQQQGGQ